MARYLVVANLTAESSALQDRVRELVGRDPEAEFELIVPTHLVSWTMQLLGNVPDHPVRLGRMRARRARRKLESVGATVSSVRLTLHEPFEAVESDLESGHYDGVVISTLPRRLSRWLHHDVPARIARHHPELEVIHVIADGHLYVPEGAGGPARPEVSTMPADAAPPAGTA